MLAASASISWVFAKSIQNVSLVRCCPTMVSRAWAVHIRTTVATQQTLHLFVQASLPPKIMRAQADMCKPSHLQLGAENGIVGCVAYGAHAGVIVLRTHARLCYVVPRSLSLLKRDLHLQLLGGVR